MCLQKGVDLLFQRAHTFTAEVLQIPVDVADRTPRGVVVCTSRMFAFEAWKTMLFSIELYRAVGVDLVVAYAESVFYSIFQLMRYVQAKQCWKVSGLRARPCSPVRVSQ